MKNNKKPHLTVESLRKSGARVRVMHQRRIGPAKSGLNKLQDWIKPVISYVPKGGFNNLSEQILNIPLPQVVLQTGGETLVEVDTKDGRHYQANAICSPRDSYNKKRGLNIALASIARQMLANGEQLN